MNVDCHGECVCVYIYIYIYIEYGDVDDGIRVKIMEYLTVE